MTDSSILNEPLDLHKIYEVSDQKTIERLIKIGTALTVERDLKELLRMIVEELKIVVSADKASLFRIDPKRERLVFYITSDEALSEMELPITRKSIAGYVAMTGETLKIDDVYELEEDSPFEFNREIDIQTDYRTKSVLTLPMLNHKNERIGVIQLINKTVDGSVVPFDFDDVGLLNALASQAAVSIENAELIKEIEDLFESFVKALASAIDARDPATKHHSSNVAAYTEAIAEAMSQFDEKELKELRIAALLHDLGKIGVPENLLKKVHKISDAEMEVIRERFQKIKALKKLEIIEEQLNEDNDASAETAILKKRIKKQLKSAQEEFAYIDASVKFIDEKNKAERMDDTDIERVREISSRFYTDETGEKRAYLRPDELEKLSIKGGNLTLEEKNTMSEHARTTAKILDKIRFSKELRNVPAIASKHHEKLNGTGYPDKLRAESIPLQARIIAVADVYDALTAQDRPYKKPTPKPRALNILDDMVQKGELDRNVYSTFIKNRIYKMEVAKDEDSTR